MFPLVFYFSVCSQVFAILPLNEGLHHIFPRNAELKRVGEKCSRNSECVTGAICHDTTCSCANTHVAISEECWRKIEPGTNGCTHTAQCEGVWPATRCRDGQCVCGGDGEEMVATRDGNICVKPGECPTNGVHGALHERGTNRVSTCLTFLPKSEKSESRSRFIGCDEYPEVYDCIAGVCCPTRGMVCIQPMNEGVESQDSRVEERWFFNSRIGQCLNFRYKGSGGNSNNFLTKTHCESYCHTGCQRGDSIILSEPPSLQDSKNLKCEASENGRIKCCPTIGFICSSNGGLLLEQPPTRLFSTGSPRKGGEVVQRWFWDAASFSCRTFQYHGQGGNFNNFASRPECVDLCSRSLCERGSPLRDFSQNVQRCSARQKCPETHECRNSACCPLSGTICSQTLQRVENCEPYDAVTKWTYSVEHAACKSFLANGCTRGDNIFDSRETCQSVCAAVQTEPKCHIGRVYKTADGIAPKCSNSRPCPLNYECVYTGSAHVCCPSREFVCRQPFVIGTDCATSSVQRWYYDSNANNCIQFDYLGCDANDNNFETRLECVESCHRSECPNGGEPLIDSTTGRSINCEKSDDCPSTHQCTRQMYNTDKVCCPSRKWICSLDADQGVPCATPSKRFHYDPQSDSCREFDYHGCGGNRNSFPTRSACYQYCQSASCGAAEVIYQPSNRESPFDCSQKSCPRNFMCVKHSWDENKRVCCGSPNFGVCSSAQYPMLEYSSQQPITCTPNVQNSCPLGFQCTYSSIRSLYFCCRDVERIEKCVKGSRPEIWPITTETRACSSDSHCAPSTRCFTPIAFSSGLCCASVDEVCPATFIYEEEKSKHAECSPLIKSSCSDDGQSVCIFSDTLSRFVCCRRETRQINTLLKCPPGSTIESTKVFCDPENACPVTHFCVKKTSDRTGICCRHPSMKRVNPRKSGKIVSKRYKCPKSESAVKIDGVIRECGTNGDCPEFSTCIPQLTGFSICCGHSIDNICPSHVYPIRRVQKCEMCGSGFECHKNYCCPQKHLVCQQPPPITIHQELTNSVTRFYYDSETNTCHSFEYHPIHRIDVVDPQNHFGDHESCIEMCVHSMENHRQLMCPARFTNPPDHPQICTPNRKSCADNESCLETLSGIFVCCVNPVIRRVRNLCGIDYTPEFDKNGQVVKCRSNNRCVSRICKLSPIVRHGICCKSKSTPALPAFHSEGRHKICAKAMNTDSPDCLPRLYPGEIECEFDEQCVASKCVSGRCTCPAGTVQFRRICTSVCPMFYKNRDGICI